MSGYVYEIYSWDGDLLYVGKTCNPFARLGQHALTQPWASEMATAKITPYETEEDALAAEAWTIAALRPIFNNQRPAPYGTGAPAPVGPSTVWKIPGTRPEGERDLDSLTAKVYEVRQKEREEAVPNPFGGFVPDVYVVTQGKRRTLGYDVYMKYAGWAEAEGLQPVTRRALFAYLEGLGARKVKTSKGVAFSGLEEPVPFTLN